MSDTSQNKPSVILPVYKNVRLTRECIQRCLPNILSEDGQLILINDASPEEDMQTMLEEWHEQHPKVVRVITNLQNRGFTASVNSGLEASLGCDVVLLNSDVLTPLRWLTILRQEAARDHRIGTVTPLSNNSTITSLPIDNASCSKLLDLDVDLINSSFDINLPLVTAPTGIGFCMLITARCLARVGMLDVQTFSEGYGEESDFCQRALKAGFLNALTPNLYCHHIGRVSFGESTPARLKAAYQQIDRLHPNYHSDVAVWIRNDPLYSSRVLRSLQIYKVIGLPFILHLNHSVGGGPMRYVNSLVTATMHDAVHIVMNGRRQDHDSLIINLFGPHHNNPIELHFNDNQDVLSLLQSLGIDCVHIHHLAGIPRIIADWVSRNTKLPHMVTFHDYYLINANPYLADASGEYEGIGASPLNSLFRNICSHPFRLEDWKSESQALISSSIFNIFPSVTAYCHYSTAFVNIPNSKVIPHDNVKTADASQHYCVVALGALGLEKGADFMEKVARSSFTMHHKSICFKIIGYAYRTLEHIEQTGPYQDSQLQSLIKEHSAGCIFFPNRCPETYSYTLSEAIHSGLPIIAPKFGVFEERLAHHKDCFLYEHRIDPIILAAQMKRFLQGTGAIQARSASVEINSFYKSDYLNIIRDACAYSRQLNAKPLFKLISMSRGQSSRV